MINLLDMLKGLWSNVNKIIVSEGVGKVFGIVNVCVVVFNISVGFYCVLFDRKGCLVKCDCVCFEELCFCVYLLVVGYYEKCLLDVI